MLNGVCNVGLANINIAVKYLSFNKQQALATIITTILEISEIFTIIDESSINHKTVILIMDYQKSRFSFEFIKTIFLRNNETVWLVDLLPMQAIYVTEI